jgi:transcriptional regulator with XRE-family HTH domain
MQRIILPLGENRKDVDAKALENLFAKGYSLKEVAKILRIDYSVLSGKISQSVSLLQARERGKRRASSKILLEKSGIRALNK